MWIAIASAISFLFGALLCFFLYEARRLKIAEIASNTKKLAERAELDRKDATQKLAELARATSYTELERESLILKRDLVNLDVALSKLRFDREEQSLAQLDLDERCQTLGKRYLSEVEKWVASGINANNFAACKQRLLKAIEWARDIGLRVTTEQEALLLQSLKDDYEKAVRVALAREEQARIRQQIREEQQRERDIKRMMDTIEHQRSDIQAALTKALAEAHEAHSEEVERLKAQLAEAEERNKRAIAQAQLTKAGHIYVVSNHGSFGPDVFKIGMTRRLEPLDRIAELGDASVPFPFDVHMMISCENAPELERVLHKEFHLKRLNKVNPRKEFFRVGIQEIARLVELRHGKVEYIAEPEAFEYQQSQNMSADDLAYIENAFDQSDDDDSAELSVDSTT